MDANIYRQLQKHLDKLPIAFPETNSGVEIRILKYFFNEEEAEIALNLSFKPESVEKIHKRLTDHKYTKVELAKKLHAMYLKGAIRAILKNTNEREFLYAVMPLEIGMYEALVDRITSDFATDFLQYKEEGFSAQVLGKKTNQMRTIPLNQDLSFDSYVDTYDNIYDIIKNSDGPFVVANCICRQMKDTVGENCNQTEIRETCIILEDGARFYINRNAGREITKQETLSIIDKARDVGMILQSENSRKPNFICCCCGCCCSVLQEAKKFPRPADYLITNYYAEVNAEECLICEHCIDRCQMEAINRVNNHVEVKNERCIGCGSCLITCDGDAIKLIKKDKSHIPPKNLDQLYATIYKERFGILKTVKFIGKAMLGQKV
jgi:Fe-S-cluster-containing hydrogenase component 2